MCPKVQQNGFIHNRDIFFFGAKPFRFNCCQKRLPSLWWLPGVFMPPPTSHHQISGHSLSCHKQGYLVTGGGSGWQKELAAEFRAAGIFTWPVSRRYWSLVPLRSQGIAKGSVDKGGLGCGKQSSKKCPVVPFKVQAMCINCSFQKRLASVLFLGLIKAQRLFRSVTIWRADGLAAAFAQVADTSQVGIGFFFFFTLVFSAAALILPGLISDCCEHFDRDSCLWWKEQKRIVHNVN